MNIPFSITPEISSALHGSHSIYTLLLLHTLVRRAISLLYVVVVRMRPPIHHLIVGI